MADTIEEFVDELASHQFADLLLLRIEDPALVTNARAIAILESAPALNRPLTSQELGWLSTLITKLTAGDFTFRKFEGTMRMLEAEWITVAEFKVVLGL